MATGGHFRFSLIHSLFNAISIPIKIQYIEFYMYYLRSQVYVGLFGQMTTD